MALQGVLNGEFGQNSVLRDECLQIPLKVFLLLCTVRRSHWELKDPGVSTGFYVDVWRTGSQQRGQNGVFRAPLDARWALTILGRRSFFGNYGLEKKVWYFLVTSDIV